MATGNLIYLVVLLCAVGGIFFAGRGRNLGQMAKYGVIWAGVFLALVAVFGLFGSLSG